MKPKVKRLVLTFCLTMLVLHAYTFWSVRRLVAAGYADFTSFYSAGLMLRSGRGRELYNAQAQQRTQEQFAPAIRLRKDPLPYLRPPFETLLFVPLTFLPYAKAYLLWNTLCLGVAIAVPFLLRSQLMALQQIPPWMLALMPLSFTPVFFALLQGQDSVLLLLLYALAYVCLRKGHERWAGCLLALGVFKPQLVLPAFLILLLRGRKKVAFGFVSIAGVLLGISAILVGWRCLRSYPAYLWSLEQNTGRELLQARDSPNLRGLLQGVLSAVVSPPSLLIAITLLSAGVIFWVARQGRGAAEDVRVGDLIFCGTMVATILASYHLFAYDLCILLVPVFLLLNYIGEKTRIIGRWSKLLLLGPVIVVVMAAALQLLWFGTHFMYLIAPALILWIWGLAREISRLQADNLASPPVHASAGCQFGAPTQTSASGG